MILAYEANTHFVTHPPNIFELAYRSDVDDVEALNVADINGDGRLDIFTVNHSYTSETLINTSTDAGHIQFKQRRDLLPQQLNMANAESSSRRPKVEEDTIGVFWLDQAIVVSNRTASQISVEISSLGPFKVNTEQPTERSHVKESPVGNTVIHVTAGREYFITPNESAMPITLRFSKRRSSALRIGHDQLTSNSNEIDFSIGDRHGAVFADFNSDQIIDVLATRGGLGGTIGKYSDKISLYDELFFGQSEGSFVPSINLLPRKNDCPAYQAGAVDLNGDRLLDLVLSCARNKPADVFVQNASGEFSRYIDEKFSGTSGYFYSPFTYFEFDGDSSGLERMIMDGNRVQLIANETVIWSDYIEFAPKRFVDFDLNSDGRQDVIVLDNMAQTPTALINVQNNKLRKMHLSHFGLPSNILAFTGADFDNDGNLDVFVPPHGIYSWKGDRYVPITDSFFRKLSIRTVDAIWADFNGDGYLDLAMALEYRQSIWRQILDSLIRADWVVTVKGEVLVFQNLSQKTQRPWLHISVDCDQGTFADVHSQIELRDSNGNLIELRPPLVSSDSWMGQGHYRRYFNIDPKIRPPVEVVATAPGITQRLQISNFNQRINLGNDCTPSFSE